MEVLNNFTGSILSLTDGITCCILTLLNANYILAGAIVSFFEQILSHLWDVLDFVRLAVEDFRLFLLEVSYFLHLIVDSSISFVCVIHDFFSAIVLAAGSSLGSLARGSLAVVESFEFLALSLLALLRYLATVFMGALLVLLQSLPYAVVTMTRFAMESFSWFFEGIRLSIMRTGDGSLAAVRDAGSKVRKIPTDAYIGLAMAFTFYVLYSKTPLGLYLSPQKVSRATKRVIRSTLRSASRLAFRSIPNGAVRLVHFLRRCTSHCLGRARRLFARATYWENEEEEMDSEEEESQMDAHESTSRDCSTANGKGQVEKLKKELEVQKERNLCVICQDQPKSVILLPCRHMCLCEECCTELLDRRSTCPLCRTVILSPIQVFT